MSLRDPTAMQKTLGMPLAIVACFAVGVTISLLPKLPVALAAFFLAVGLTCLTYSYLGGHLEAGKNEGSGTFGILSFKLGGSIVTFLVSWLFLNHHLALSGQETARKVSLESGRDNIRVEVGSRQLGLLEGADLETWVQEMAEVDYFHPALILARRPFCSDNPGKCVLNAGFRAAAAKDPRVTSGTMKLCVIGQSVRDVEDTLQDASLQPLLNKVEVMAASLARSVDPDGGGGDSLRLKGSYVKGGSLGDRCRNIALPREADSSPTIRVGALMNPDDLKVLVPKGIRGSVEVKILFE